MRPSLSWRGSRPWLIAGFQGQEEGGTGRRSAPLPCSEELWNSGSHSPATWSLAVWLRSPVCIITWWIPWDLDLQNGRAAFKAFWGASWFDGFHCHYQAVTVPTVVDVNVNSDQFLATILSALCGPVPYGRKAGGWSLHPKAKKSQPGEVMWLDHMHVPGQAPATSRDSLINKCFRLWGCSCFGFQVLVLSNKKTDQNQQKWWVSFLKSKGETNSAEWTCAK